MVAARIDPGRAGRQRRRAAPAAESSWPPDPLGVSSTRPIPPPPRRPASSSRLHGLTAEQRHSELVDLVCRNAATVLGRPNTARHQRRQRLPRPRVRLTDRRRTAQPAQSRYRTDPFTHADLRLPDARSCWPSTSTPGWRFTASPADQPNLMAPLQRHHPGAANAAEPTRLAARRQTAPDHPHPDVADHAQRPPGSIRPAGSRGRGHPQPPAKANSSPSSTKNSARETPRSASVGHRQTP